MIDLKKTMFVAHEPVDGDGNIKISRDILLEIFNDRSEIINALSEAKAIMFKYQNHVDREKWIDLCFLSDRWNERYFGDK
jgi:hypothetical protein